MAVAVGDCSTRITGDMFSGRLPHMRADGRVWGSALRDRYCTGPDAVKKKNCGKQLLVLSCLSVRPPTWNNWSSTGRINMKFGTLLFYKIENSSSIRSDKITGTLFWALRTSVVTSGGILLRRRNVHKVRTHFLLIHFFSRHSCRLWDNVETCGRVGQD